MKHKNIKGTYVSVEDGNITKAIDSFNWKLKQIGFWREMKNRRYYTKPSEIRHMRKQNIKKYGYI